MSESKTVDEIDTSYSKSQIYWRINKLVESGIMDPPERGDRNQYLLDSGEIRILRRLSELEESQDTVREAIEELEQEKLREVSKEELRDRVEELEARTDTLESKVQLIEEELSVQSDRLKHFRKRWTKQLQEGAKKIKDMFG